MKKLLGLLVLLIGVFTLAGCVDNDEPQFVGVTISSEIEEVSLEVNEGFKLFNFATVSAAAGDYTSFSGSEEWLIVDVDNPNEYELISITVNGTKYQLGATEYPGSERTVAVSLSLQNIYIPITIANTSEDLIYTIEEIKMIRNENIVAVDMTGKDNRVTINVIQMYNGAVPIYNEEDLESVPDTYLGPLVLMNDIIIETYVPFTREIGLFSEGQYNITFLEENITLSEYNLFMDNIDIIGKNITLPPNFVYNNGYIKADRLIGGFFMTEFSATSADVSEVNGVDSIYFLYLEDGVYKPYDTMLGITHEVVNGVILISSSGEVIEISIIE